LLPSQTAAVLDAARQAGLWIGGELSLFAQGLRELHESSGYAPKVLAITGTNGKTTVTALTGHLLHRAGQQVAIAGNIGPTLLDTLQEAIDTAKAGAALPQTWVLELSSFQLATSDGFEPTAATVLNLSQDHLDWHGNMADYAAAKARIFGEQGLLVLNRDDAAVMAMLPETAIHSEKSGSPKKSGKPDKNKPLRACLTFGQGLPTRPGDYGLETVNGMTWLVRALESDETRRLRKGEVEEIHIQRLMPADALRIRGRHNAVNALAALALASSTGCSLASMLFGLREYKGEPHRVESVAIVHDVEYFDDSKGTNVGATVAALNGLGAERRVVVILGGDGKGQDFSPLAEPVSRYSRAVVLIGRDAPLIREELKLCGVPLIDASTLPEAVNAAKDVAQAGDAVLLSPACASFDMFRDYPHRAQVFCQAVADIADAAGQMVEGSP
jgi:UDP-N-acetylmuramoylalanine--D-glutamate ligase